MRGAAVDWQAWFPLVSTRTWMDGFSAAVDGCFLSLLIVITQEEGVDTQFPQQTPQKHPEPEVLITAQHGERGGLPSAP